MATKRPTVVEYDEYIYDYDTSNASFIAMASILYRKGIKNYNFFLKLYDEDLVGVNPHDPNLDMETKFKIIIECRRNFWYFIREVMIIPGTGRFKLHRGNLAGAWSLVNNLATYMVLPRQHGKTWLVVSFALWVFNFASDYTNMLFMNKQLGDSQLNLDRLKNARDALPDYLQMKSGVNDKGVVKDFTSNVNTVKNGLHNQINVKSSARNPIAADELGRGMTVAWVWIDEIAFLQFNRIIYAAMIPAWRKAAEISIKKGRPTARVLTTTPGDLAVDHGKFAYEIKENAATFNESLYNMDSDELLTWLSKNSKNGYLYIEFMYYQLDHPNPDEWFEEQCKDLLYDWPKIRREVLIQWNNASSNSPFDEEDLKDLRYMMINESEEDSIIINKYYKLNVYRKLNPADKYIICIDPARGRGEQADRTAVVVTDAKTNKVHAVFKSNCIQYKETFRFVYTLVYHHIPNSVLIVENNIDTLIEYFKNSTLRHLLYYEFPRTPTKDKRKKGILQKPNNSNIVYGVTTSSGNRPKYFDILFEYVRTAKDLICVRELVEEIESLEYKTSTRIEAVSGTHDDVVMAYLLGQYVMHEGTNKARFGLFFANGLGNELKQISKSVFERNKMDYNAMERPEAYDSPFLNELLIPQETIEELEKRWQKGLSVGTTDEIAPFAGKKNSFGISEIDPNSFYDLNCRSSIPESYQFGTLNDERNDLDFMADLNNDWF